MALTITPLSDTIGAEVGGADLSRSAPAGDVAAIRQALIDHLVIVIRDQSLDPEQLLAALRLFGDTMEQHLTDTLMEAHPEIAVLDSRAMPPDKQGRVIPFGGRDWHTDHTIIFTLTLLCSPAASHFLRIQTRGQNQYQ